MPESQLLGTSFAPSLIPIYDGATTNGRSALETEDLPQEAHEHEDITEKHSFDELTKGLADGSLLRRRALKLLVSILIVGRLLTLIPGVAGAQGQSIGVTVKGA